MSLKTSTNAFERYRLLCSGAPVLTPNELRVEIQAAGLRYADLDAAFWATIPPVRTTATWVAQRAHQVSPATANRGRTFRRCTMPVDVPCSHCGREPSNPQVRNRFGYAAYYRSDVASSTAAWHLAPPSARRAGMRTAGPGLVPPGTAS